MPGCRGCTRGCKGYVKKDVFSQTLSKMGGGAFNSCAVCQCHESYHYWESNSKQ